jgi:hypothetical protein
VLSLSNFWNAVAEASCERKKREKVDELLVISVYISLALEMSGGRRVLMLLISPD